MNFDANGWLDAAIEIDYLSKSESRQGYSPTHIVLHGTAGGVSAEAVARNVFQDPSIEASAHFIIGQDGRIVQGVPCSLAAWGNGAIVNPRLPWPASINPNLYTISIEHCKPSSDNSDALTSAQQQASFQLVQALCDHYGIPKRRGDVNGGIVEHADFDTVNRSRCPGPYPWQDLQTFLNGATMNIPQGWTDNGTALIAPNGHRIVAGFRTFILTNNWDASNLPLGEEYGVQGVPGTRQLFDKSALIWTPQNGVQVAPLGYWYMSAIQPPANVSQAVQAIGAAQTALNQAITALGTH